MAKYQGRELSEERRREIFRAVVEAQDGGASVAEARQLMMKRFGVTEQQVREIEKEGLDEVWPPL